MATTDSRFENLRDNINPKFAHYSDSEMESLLARNGADAAAMEGFFSDLGKFASSAGKAVLQAAPSILPIAGSIVGTAFGGPLGASLGGSLGSLAGGALGAATGQRPAAGGGGAAGGIGGLISGGLGSLMGGSPAAAQLMQMVGKPETMRALASMAMGPMGAPSIPVGDKSVPPSAFTNLLKMMMQQAESEYAETMARATNRPAPDYMLDYAGEAVADPAIAANRAEALYELLQSTGDTDREQDSEAEAEAEAEQENEAIQAEWDEMELMELYEMYEAEEA